MAPGALLRLSSRRKSACASPWLWVQVPPSPLHPSPLAVVGGFRFFPHHPASLNHAHAIVHVLDNMEGMTRGLS